MMVPQMQLRIDAYSNLSHDSTFTLLWFSSSAIQSFISVTFIALSLSCLALGYSQLMVRDGPVSDNELIGYIGCSYQAIRYEPLCGTLGTDYRFQTKSK